MVYSSIINNFRFINKRPWKFVYPQKTAINLKGCCKVEQNWHFIEPPNPNRKCLIFQTLFGNCNFTRCAN